MSEISVTFKNKKIYKTFTTVSHHPILKNLVIWFEQTFGEPYITSSYRENSAGVHSTIPLRGLDIRSYIYNDPIKIVETINKVWMYDYNRPHLKCAIYHDVGQGVHIHLQVHPNTRKI